MNHQPILTIAIATTEARLAGIDVKRLPFLPDVKWHIFAQASQAKAWPDHSRQDVSLTLTTGTGAARNRNAALLAVDTEFLLFADDDLTFSAPGLEALIARFQAEPEEDFLCARLSDDTGAPRKRYSPDRTRARWWNCAKVGTPELALRPRSFRAREINFDTRFGAGTADPIGDEYIFLADALRAGLTGRHVNVTVACHPKESSGTRDDSSLIEVRRRVFIRALGRWRSLPARAAFALRHWRTFANWRMVWCFIS